MATYTMTETGRLPNGNVSHRVDRDGDVIADALDYNEAQRTIVNAMTTSDFYQEVGFARLTWAQLMETIERVAAFDRRH